MNAYYNLGVVYDRQRNIEKAIQYYKKAIEMDSSYGVAYANLGDSYYTQGDFADATAHYSKAFKIDINTIGTDRHIYWGFALENLDKFDEAVQHYNKASQMDFDQLRRIISAGQYYDIVNKTKIAEITNKYNAEEANGLNHRAWVYANTKIPDLFKPREAIQLATKAVELTNWKNATFIATLADAYYSNEQYQNAIETIKRALALEPDNKEFQKKLKKFESTLSNIR